jgi:probable rRNA maturation factor
MAPEPRCRIEIEDETGRAEVNLAQIQQVVDAALAEDGMSGCALTVLVDDAASAELHAEHFAAPEPTDVMTFPDGSVDPGTGLTLLGDLAVGVDVAIRAAAERGRPASAELTLYVLHGVLHLLGYDDVDAADQQAMWEVQRRLLADVGISLEAEPS